MTRASIAVTAAAAVAAIALAGCAPQTQPAPNETSQLAPFLIDQDFPDPDLLAADGQYYAFATNTRGSNVQFATSRDLIEWKVSLEDALPDLPGWASPGRTWAPEVSELPSGGFVMYFTAQESDSGKQCIGAATSAIVTGPYVPVDGEPLICPLDDGGAIDASAFTDDDGSRYLVWKNDGNCCGLDTWISLSPLSVDGTALSGAPTQLFKQTETWEGTLVEAPVLVKHGGSYLIFYSANDYGGQDYTIGVAAAPAITGPYEKQGAPFLSTDSSDGAFIGPGGQDVLTTPEGDILFFHSWSELLMYRGMHSAPLEWDGDVPTVSLD